MNVKTVAKLKNAAREINVSVKRMEQCFSSIKEDLLIIKEISSSQGCSSYEECGLKKKICQGRECRYYTLT